MYASISFYFSTLLVELYMNFSHKEQDCSDTLAMFERDFTVYLVGC